MAEILPSAPQLEDLNNDEDVDSLLKSPRFLKKLIYMNPETHKLYERELQNKKEERLRKIEELEEIRSSPLSILAKILKYMWKTCLLLNFFVFLARCYVDIQIIRYFENSTTMKNIIILVTSANDIYTLITIPFVFSSIFMMILFADF